MAKIDPSVGVGVGNVGSSWRRIGGLFRSLNDNVGGQTTQSPNFASVGPLVNVTLRQTTTTTGRPTKLDELTVQRKQQEQQKLKQSKTTPNDLSTEESSLASSSTSSGVSVIETTLCDCPEIEVTSKVDQINSYFRRNQNSKCARFWSYK